MQAVTMQASGLLTGRTMLRQVLLNLLVLLTCSVADLPTPRGRSCPATSPNCNGQPLTPRAKNKLKNRATKHFTSKPSRLQQSTVCRTHISGRASSNRLRPIDRYWCKRQLAIFDQADAILRKPAAYTAQIKQIDRRAKLSYREYLTQYLQAGKPVVIQGMSSRMNWSGVDLDRIVRLCGDRHVNPSYQNANARWAGMEAAEESVTLREWVQSLGETDSEEVTDRGYIFDWGLPEGCPELLEGTVIPSYIARNLFKLFPAALEPPGSNWPSLFIGPQGTRSALHIDSFSSHFWMLLLQGRKRWRIYPSNDSAALYMNSFTGSFVIGGFETAAEISYLQAKHAPLLAHAAPWEFDQHPGELVLVPYNSPHQVVNSPHAEGLTIGIAGNVLDDVNWDSFVQEIRGVSEAGGPGTEGAKALYDYVAGQKLDPTKHPNSSRVHDQQDVLWIK